MDGLICGLEYNLVQGAACCCSIICALSSSINKNKQSKVLEKLLLQMKRKIIAK
jgi:hypothetical protein